MPSSWVCVGNRTPTLFLGREIPPTCFPFALLFKTEGQPCSRDCLCRRTAASSGDARSLPLFGAVKQTVSMAQSSTQSRPFLSSSSDGCSRTRQAGCLSAASGAGGSRSPGQPAGGCAFIQRSETRPLAGEGRS